ncbi:BadF/BadG/BcrA/BcrD ATPase family [Acholeplasma oculi]|uniref:ATPase, BadF/BadG/BcrA/BcrD type n=1 Tax=Acholeplasma oculi TaxID=35623 RepID=A0A061AJU5_9MOLU|nr:BadF/BadG/BcrA/BcrD ATPase family protein [Acholeplasma oculi]CDR31252.1 ATPase, BadF/BadG/BcrA/BcrD type [Acholeplasma oculi]SKC38426.1 BadF-type ATPase [Acholeplasma oculi]SUT91356.1 BadF/BadG/BcrA/BcrD ATPase family [Acholeplasma oculi]
MSNILSIDGGGTKTLGVLYHESGVEINRALAGSSNFAVDYVEGKKTIIEVIDRLVTKDTALIVIGIAGYSMVPNIALLTLDIKEKYQIPVEIHPDAYLGLYSAYDKLHPLVYVVGGTGSIIYSLNDGLIKRFGGYGHLFGDEGSAYGFVMNFMKDILNRLDEDKKLNRVQQSILNALKLETKESIIGFVHKEKKQDIASIAALITAKNDSYVKKLLIKEASVIAKSIEKVSKINQFKQPFKLALRGGFIQNAPIVIEEIKTQLQKKEIQFLMEKDIREAVYGGYNLYLISKGKEI